MVFTTLTFKLKLKFLLLKLKLKELKSKIKLRSKQRNLIEYEFMMDIYLNIDELSLFMESSTGSSMEYSLEDNYLKESLVNLDCDLDGYWSDDLFEECQY
jgi:hypothetical protein